MGQQEVVTRFADVLLQSLALEFVYICTTALDGAEIISLRQREEASDVLALRTTIDSLITHDGSDSAITVPDPWGNGKIRVAVTHIPAADNADVLVTGSRNDGYPADQDRMLLSVASNQLAVVLGQHRGEEQLREQRELLRVILASIGDAVIATDTQERVTFLNPVAEGLTGWNSQDAYGQSLATVFRILHEQTRQPVESPVDKVLREGRVVGLGNHTILIAKDGTELPIDDSAAPIRDATGELLGVVLVFRDVTEQRRAEQQLHASEARKTAILQAALDCIITMDHEGNIVEFNPAAENTFGYHRKDVIGRRLADVIIPPSLRERHHTGLAHYLATGEGPALRQRLEVSALHADGSEFPVELAITRIPADGPPLFTAYLRDISDRKRAEQHHNVRLAVTQVLIQAATVEEAARGILEAVCVNLRWNVGFLWLVDGDIERLSCRECWHQPEAPVTTFETASRSLKFHRGEGLPGRVWETAKPMWLLDVTRNGNFPRAASAAQEHLKSAFACPITIDHEVLGVLEFYTRQLREPDDDLLEMMTSMAAAFGQFIERKTAEEAVRRSERELADFFDNATIGLHCAGPDGIILRANRAELDMLGYTQEEYVGRHIADFHADRPVIDDILKCLKAGENLHNYEARLRCKDGTIKNVLIDSNVLWRDGKFVHTRCFTRDITDRKKYEEALRQNEKRLKLANDAGRLGTWEWHIPTGRVIWSTALEAIHGLPPGGFNGTFEEYQKDIHPDDRQHVLETIRNTVENRQEHHLEYRIVWPDGSIHWLEARGQLFCDDEGYPERLIGVCSDVTPHKRQEESLRFLAEASKSLSALTDYRSTLQTIAHLAVPGFADWCAVDIVNSDGVLERLAVAHIDPEKVHLAEELHRRYPSPPDAQQGVMYVLRTGKSDMAGEIADELLVAGAKDADHLRILRELKLKSYICVPLRSNETTLGVLTFVTAESGRRYANNDLALAEDLAHRAAVAIDNARLYHEIREADRRKDEFLAMLAHELRNPLAPIRSGLDLLAMNPNSDRETVSLMQDQVEHVVRLVDDLLDVSRIMRGRIELRKETVAIATIINRSAESIRPSIEERGQTLTISMPGHPIWLYIDPVRLVQVVENLLNNASKYTDTGGRIELAVEREKGDAVIRVRDTGIGIEPESLPNVFDLFMQSPRTLDRAQGGLGIGLTLVQRLVQLHDGTVAVESQGLGHGSTFTVRLPTIAAPAGVKAVAASPSTTAGRRILVVDDNVGAVKMLAMLLTKLNDQAPATAHDGVAALAMIEQTRPEIVFLDIGLPRMDGYQVAKEVRRRHDQADILLVALTGYGYQEDRQKSKKAGFDEHLVKPPSIEQLKAMLDHPKLRKAT